MERRRTNTIDDGLWWRKMLVFMRVTLLMMLMFPVGIKANALAQVGKVSVKMEQATIDEIIKSVRTDAGYQFLYRVEEVNRYGKRDINLQNVSID